MITIHWKSSDNKQTQEIWSGIKLPSNGKLYIRVLAGRKDLNQYVIQMKDPLMAIIFSKSIPTVIKGEYWQIEFSLMNYLMKGKYVISVRNEMKEYLNFFFYLDTRKQPKQVFLVEHKLLCTNLNNRIDSVEVMIEDPPDGYFLQTTGSSGIRGAEYRSKNVIGVNQLMKSKQKTISWWHLVQPSFLPLDTYFFENKIDEYYVFNKVSYSDTPGLEISSNGLEKYQGTSDPSYPVLVIKDVLEHVHQNMRYVRQNKERGVSYALKYGRGDCTEYSAFFVTLLRKLGIHARIVSGMGRSLYNNWIAHAFAEVFLYGAWIPIDVVKPPKPYTFIGNRGDLIGLSRDNWLDPDYRNFEVKFMGLKNSSPKINITQKVTEDGKNKLTKEVRIEKPRTRRTNKFFSHRHREYRLINKDNNRIIQTQITDANTQSIGLIAGRPDFGRIINIQYVSTELELVTIEIPELIEPKTDLYLIQLDKVGKLQQLIQINY